MNGREAALLVLNKVETGGYADALLAERLSSVPVIDRSLATELSYGVLRYRGRLDWIINTFSHIKTKKLEHTVLNALRLGVYQLYVLDNIPVSAAINESVNLVKPLGQKKAGFVNATLRSASSKKEDVVFPAFEQDPLRNISIEYSHPIWLVERWLKRFGPDEAKRLCMANLAPPPKTLRVNTLRLTRLAAIERLVANNIEAQAAHYSPDGLQIIGSLPQSDHYGYLQDEGSQLIPYLLSPLPNETILDACAAPGGKTTHIAALMKNTGAIYAIDKDAKRLKQVQDTATRLGAANIKTIEADATRPLPLTVLREFDAILCDAPCSGLGVIGRTPEIKWRRSSDDLKDLGSRQGRLLDNLAAYVKPQGRIVYSVCSFEPEETDNIIDGFLESHKGFVQEDAARILPQGCAELVDKQGRLRTFPHKHGMDGFFAVRLRRIK